MLLMLSWLSGLPDAVYKGGDQGGDRKLGASLDYFLSRVDFSSSTREAGITYTAGSLFQAASRS